MDFQGGSVKNLLVNARATEDTGSIPGSRGIVLVFIFWGHKGRQLRILNSPKS